MGWALCPTLAGKEGFWALSGVPLGFALSASLLQELLGEKIQFLLDDLVGKSVSLASPIGKVMP